MWLAYSIACIFRRSSNGSHIYMKPEYLHPYIFIAFIINISALITWLLLWKNRLLGVSKHIFTDKSLHQNDNLYSKWALFAMIIMLIAIYAALFISYRKLKQNKENMRKLDM